jgi:hypothetical protein
VCLVELLEEKMRHHRLNIAITTTAPGFHQHSHGQGCGVVWIVGSGFVRLAP